MTTTWTTTWTRKHSTRPATGAIDTVTEPPVSAGDLDPSRPAPGGRRRLMASGLVTEVTVPPVTGVQSFSALLVPDCVLEQPAPQGAPDGAGPRSLRLVWQGQRSVPGVTAGSRLRCVGVVSFRDGQPTMFNPRYEIVAKQVSR
ncbi:hypothetical protein GCM10011374_18700 [Kocuria dechangensis]|uniref:OB-fold nucleic acid binding domain-containing protein n=1 Tax=Kocuria dechangensis TaxID=1176249 RepID=A0A917LTJ9_9MICC|nr:hypothetical protein [Kocuria dechangensis]GGG56037.1 hypothetical protein GCM10011374_18700 [Kocuria dechangensis]